MIVDDLRNARQYYGLGARFEQGLRWLAEQDVAGMAPECYELAGDDLFAMVQEYDTKPKSEGFWEAHREYADIQYVVSGAEHMGYAPIDALTQGEYDEGRDFLALDGEGVFLEMRAGTFIVLLPQDGHMPQMAIEAPTPVKKVVVKVRL